jgi:hypothetical protein
MLRQAIKDQAKSKCEEKGKGEHKVRSYGVRNRVKNGM